VTYGAVIAVLLAMRVSEMSKSEPVQAAAGQLKKGWEYVRQSVFIKTTLIMMLVIGTFAYEFQVSLALLSEYTFVTGAAGYATLMSAFGAGAVAGGLLSAGRIDTTVRQFLAFGILFGFSIIVTSIAPIFPIAVAGMLATGFFSINMLSLGQTMVQLKSAPEMRGRIMALWSMALLGSTPIGGPIIGFIGEHVGARWGVGVGGIAAILAILYGYVMLVRRETMTE
jgi:MFS family permease